MTYRFIPWDKDRYEKVLYCLTGSIVFHLDEESVKLEPGDRLESIPEPSTRPTSDRTAWNAWRPPEAKPCEPAPAER